jgi:hypothetical protein
MTTDDIKAEIAAGSIGAMTLDTSAFGNPSEMSLEHGLLARLRQFCGTGVRLLMSDVVLNEVELHMAKGASDSLAQLEKSLKAVGGSWNVSREARGEAKKALIGAETPREHASRRVNGFVERNECIIVKAEEHASIEELMRRYFSFQPPFAERESKKNEFPDALAVMSLNAWAEQNDTKILVVSNDDDWVRYCEGTSRLIVIRGLAEALALFNANAEVVCSALSLRLASHEGKEWRDFIETAVQAHIESMLFIAEADSQFYFEDEITEVVVESVEIQDDEHALRPVEMLDGSIVAEITVVAEVEISCDFSFSVKDGIDKDYVPMGSASVSTRETLDLNVLVTFDSNIPEKADIEDVEPEKNRKYISFGHVEPDWMNDPSNYEE